MPPLEGGIINEFPVLVIKRHRGSEGEWGRIVCAGDVKEGKGRQKRGIS